MKTAKKNTKPKISKRDKRKDLSMRAESEQVYELARPWTLTNIVIPAGTKIAAHAGGSGIYETSIVIGATTISVPVNPELFVRMETWPQFGLTAERTTINRGEAVKISWHVSEGIEGVYFWNGNAYLGVGGTDYRTVSPYQDTDYWLKIIAKGGQEFLSEHLTIKVKTGEGTVTQNAAKLLGIHELSGANKAAEALARGCRAVMCFENARGAYELAKQYPDAIVMHRKDFRHQIAPADLLGAHGINVNESSDSRVWYRGCNENDVDGIGSDPDSIRRRARFDIECATLLRNAAPNAKWVAGGFAHGNPDFTNAEVCKAVREAYADAYNSGLIMFDIHNYSKPAPGAPPKDFKTFGAIWLMRRWEFLFTHCGFDPNVRGIVSSETGHECGFGGFRAAGFTVNEFAEWCEYSLSVQLAPLVVNGVKYPSPMLVQTFFQHGNTYNGAGGWWGYGMDDYIEYLTGRWQGGAKALFEDMRGDTAFLYEGSQPDYVEPPAKDISR